MFGGAVGGRDSWGAGLKSSALSELLMPRKTGTLLRRPVNSQEGYLIKMMVVGRDSRKDPHAKRRWFYFNERWNA